MGRAELREQKVRKRPGRNYPRAVKRKMSNFPVTSQRQRREAFQQRSFELTIA